MQSKTSGPAPTATKTPAQSGPITIKDQMAMPWPTLVATTLKRPVALLSKAISFRGAAVALATWLVAIDKIDGWQWVLMTAAIVLGQKALDRFKK